MRLWGRRVFAWMLGTGGEGIESRRRRQAEQTNSKQIEAKIGEGSIHGWEGGRSAAPALPSRALPSPVPSRLRTRGIPMRLATATALLGGDWHRDWLSALALHWHRNKLKPRSGEKIPEVQTQSIARPIHCKPFFVLGRPCSATRQRWLGSAVYIKMHVERGQRRAAQGPCPPSSVVGACKSMRACRRPPGDVSATLRLRFGTVGHRLGWGHSDAPTASRWLFQPLQGSPDHMAEVASGS